MLLVKHKLMQSGLPSRTALAAAAHRAAHQALEKGCIFADPLALRILGENAKSLIREAAEDPSRYRMRIFIAMRTRFAENVLAAAMEHGVRQLVMLVRARCLRRILRSLSGRNARACGGFGEEIRSCLS